MGRTPHEVHDEMCRRASGRCRLTPPRSPTRAHPPSCPPPSECRHGHRRRRSADPHPRARDRATSSTTFDDGVRRYLAGEIDEDVFRVFRLNQGIYGQRQGGHNQMVRVKIPYGRIDARAARDARLHRRRPTRAAGATSPPARTSSSTSSQLEQAPEVLRLLASVGLTTREACGDTVRNVAGCHLAGACPFEVLDITPVGRGRRPSYFLRNPYRPAPARASSRSTSPAASPTAARRCSTTSA